MRMFSDFRDIVKMNGVRGLYRGFTPYLLACLIESTSIESDPVMIPQVSRL